MISRGHYTQLYAWRQEVVAAPVAGASAKRRLMRFAARVLASPRLYRAAGRLARVALRRLPRTFVYRPFNVWGRARDLPAPPAESFRDWYVRHRQTGGRS